MMHLWLKNTIGMSSVALAFPVGPLTSGPGCSLKVEVRSRARTGPQEGR